MILFLIACAAQAGDPPSPSSVQLVATFSTYHSPAENGLVVEECAAQVDDITWDYSLCCPRGWVVLGLTRGADGGYLVVCGL